ncbi:MAG: GGDEF domain-containing protein [Candidatus Acidiferrales bacterium]
MLEKRKSRKRILIAEDDPVSRRLLQAFLVKWGYQVVAAGDGAEALRILESDDAPPLAVMDWMMPGIEGPEICRRVRANPDRPYVYILLLTARSQKGDLLAGLTCGADDYLTKPFDAAELRARLHVGQRILDLQDNLIAVRDELRYRASHDALTGVANRSAILDALARERSRQSRERGSFGIILADIDHFKAVNDTYGHLCGDVVLKEVARRMSSCVRPYDTVGRYGGEEFLIVVPASDTQGTLVLAERIRRIIESQPITTESGQVKITLSLGAAVSDLAKPAEAQTLLQIADEALYRAKKRGRNRSEMAACSDLTSSSPLSSELAMLRRGSD